jgi:glycosyltransferase involved in cell wall biosynthesis
MTFETGNLDKIGDCLVSICVPTYNSSKYLEQCLISIERQSYKNIEVIISDNYSDDNSVEIAEKYCLRHSGTWRLMKSEINIGAINNFNKLIGEAKGEYIAIYHADDIYDYGIVETCVNILINNQQLNLVGTMAYVIDANGNKLHRYVTSGEISDYTTYAFNEVMLGITKNRLLQNGDVSILLVTPSIMVRSIAYNSVGLFGPVEKYNSASDYEMWLRLALDAPIGILNMPLMSYRVHVEQGSNMEVINNPNLPDIISVMEKYQRYIYDIEVLMQCWNWMNRITFGVALKQNRLKDFKRSEISLGRCVNSSGMILFFVGKFILSSLNRMHLSLPLVNFKLFR